MRQCTRPVWAWLYLCYNVYLTLSNKCFLYGHADREELCALLELKGVSMNILTTPAIPAVSTTSSQISQPALPDHLAQMSEDSGDWSYCLFSLTTQMVSQTDRLMGIHVLFIAGKQIMTQ